jgi:HEAT repeat protein
VSRFRWVLLIAAAFAAAGMVEAAAAGGHRPPAQVFDRSAEPGPLAAKVDRAVGEASASAAGRAFWVGYSIDRLMGENSHIGTFTDGPGGRDITVAGILAGKGGSTAAIETSQDVQKAAQAAVEKIDGKGRPEKKVVKELGFFLKFGVDKPPLLAGFAMSNLDLSFDFEGAPLHWLGKVTEAESLDLISSLYGRNRGDEVREGLIAAAGCHGTAKLALPFLARVLGGDGTDELRKNAAFWTGQLNDPEGLRLLAKTARSDRSEEVREGAVFGISQVELPEAVDELVALARGAEKRDVRKQAVFWLGQMASEKSGGVLEDIALKDSDIEIQEQAVFALSQLPDNQGVDPLIKLAKTHPDPRIRKKAVFWLGECDDPRALEAIIAIIKGK